MRTLPHDQRLHDQRPWMAAAAALLACACGSPAPKSPPPASSAPESQTPATLPWTRDFMEESVLVAREVRIEGPPGLLEHVAVRQELDSQDVDVRTVPEGLLQETLLKPGAAGVIWCQLDNLTINAETRLRVLERVGEVPVRVLASGDAYWKNARSGEERRGERLELVGKRPR